MDKHDLIIPKFYKPEKRDWQEELRKLFGKEEEK